VKLVHNLLFFVLICSAGTGLFGQIVGSNCFLQGCYVEIGISNCGVYGTTTVPGAGPFGPYHPNVGSYLGFVADHEKDGWDVATGPGASDYCGDYFVPGAPVEGWQIQSGGSVYTNTDVGCWSSAIPGSVTGYSDTGGFKSATWEGSIAAIDLSVTQKTIFPDGALFFLTSVTLCNDGATDLNDIYYKRNVDPDQDQPWPGGFFQTDNIVVTNTPTSDTALVTAEGTTYGCFLGIGAIDPRARVSWGNFGTADGTPQQAYSGTGGYSTSGTSLFSDIAIQITFQVDIPAGECTTINFAHVLDPSDLDQALLATFLGTISVMADSVLIDTTGGVDLCLGDTVRLEVLYGDDYDWTWTPAEGLNTDTGTVVFAFPEDTTTYTVTGVGECATITYQITINVYNAVGFADAGPDLTICLGDTAMLLGSGGEVYTWSPPVYLSDPNISTPLVENPLTDMYYQLIVKNNLGCSDTDDVAVFLFDNPDIDAGEDQYMLEGGFAELSASGGIEYFWTPVDYLSDPEAQTTNAYPIDTTVYYVLGIDANGCENIDSMTVFVLEQTLVASPTAFTPNGDGLNDTYKPILIGIGDITGFEIYSRWGELLYETTDETRGWDGTFKALEQEIGNYVVVIHATDGFGAPFTKTSMVLLMR